MFGADLFASLALAASIMAPALTPRSDWIGEVVFIKKSDTTAYKLDPDGNFKPIGRVRSIQYVVSKEEKGHVRVMQDGKPAWLAKDDLVRLKDAVDYYTKMLDQEPNSAAWFAYRGWARFRQGQPEEALKDYAEAIRLNPTAGLWYGNRGLIHLETKKYDDAIADFTTCIDQSIEQEMPQSAEIAYRNRAMAHSRKKEYAKAAADYAASVEINPESPATLNGLAWILATAPEAKVRDGKRAVDTAKKACELTDHKNGGYLDTLAAAYAEVGEFEKAVEWQQKAIQRGDLPVKELDGARKRLELYKQKKPYRGDE